MYEYRASIVKIVDGDTVDLVVDCGFNVQIRERFRLMGLNTPESSGKDACPAGLAAKARLAELLPVGSVVVVKTERDKTEKYGRYMGTILVGGVCVNERMVLEGHAVKWDGKGLRPVKP